MLHMMINSNPVIAQEFDATLKQFRRMVVRWFMHLWRARNLSRWTPRR
jgi:hypothetical protein